MPRPRCCRRIAGAPCARVFKPAGQPATSLEEVTLTLEEYEAIRLADFEALYQEDAAKRMGVSRQTFGRTIALARGKVARALVLGCALRIEVTEADAAALDGTPVARGFLCQTCGHSWQEPFGTGRPAACPACGGTAFQRKGCTGSGSSCGRTDEANHNAPRRES